MGLEASEPRKRMLLPALQEGSLDLNSIAVPPEMRRLLLRLDINMSFQMACNIRKAACEPRDLFALRFLTTFRLPPEVHARIEKIIEGVIEASWQERPGKGDWAEAVASRHPEDALRLLPASRNIQSITQQPDIWRCFCFLRWGRGANLHLYDHAKDCFRDQNGWFPWQGMVRSPPCFEVRCLKTHQQGCASMDLRTTTQELVTVSEAVRQLADMRVFL
eukprot:s3723_g1.t1